MLDLQGLTNEYTMFALGSMLFKTRTRLLGSRLGFASRFVTCSLHVACNLFKMSLVELTASILLCPSKMHTWLESTLRNVCEKAKIISTYFLENRHLRPYWDLIFIHVFICQQWWPPIFFSPSPSITGNNKDKWTTMKMVTMIQWLVTKSQTTPSIIIWAFNKPLNSFSQSKFHFLLSNSSSGKKEEQKA